MTSDFFTGYRKTLIKPNEILVSILIPKTRSNQYFYAYKQSKRREDDIAIVTAAFNIILKLGTEVVEDISIALGGMGPKTILAQKTQNSIKGFKWDTDLVEIVTKSLSNECELEADAPGGMIAYRKSLVSSLFYKAYLETSKALNGAVAIDLSATRKKNTLGFKGRQTFEVRLNYNFKIHIINIDSIFS
jgi:xanthine dehydrogenase/oxidase